MDERNEIAVLHLIWLPLGIARFQQFIQSYQQYEAGAAHTLVIVFNGVQQPADTAAYHAFLHTSGIEYKSIEFKDGQDLECYFRAAAMLSHEYLLILNSFSVILSNHWLRKYMDNLSDPAIGLVGATGSCQSYYSSVFQKNRYGWQQKKSVAYNVSKYKLFVKAFFYWRFLFRPFPNPHLRTNAFIINRKLFLQLRHKPFTSKFAAYQFESGRRSMTNQLLQMKYKVVVMDINGKTYMPSEWRASNTFWMANQENLLVADNQTSLYAHATPAEKKEMTRLAWGSA